MKAFITHILPQHPATVSIQWDLTEVTESGHFDFTIYRSGSSGGPWTTLATVHNLFTYTDTLAVENAQTLSLVRDIYYKISVDPPSHTIVSSAAVNLDGLIASEIVASVPAIGPRIQSPGQQEPYPAMGEHFDRPFPDISKRKRLLKCAIQRHQYIGLLSLYGIWFWLLKRKHFGTRCALCYDPRSREVINSQCPSCYGTSWQGGYFTPILQLGKKIESPTQSQVTPQSKDDTHFTQIQLLDFPRLDEGDLLVEKYTNKRFLVRGRTSGTIKGIQVFQVLSVSELPQSAAEYAVSVSL